MVNTSGAKNGFELFRRIARKMDPRHPDEARDIKFKASKVFMERSMDIPKIMKAIARLDEQNDEFYDKTGEHIPDSVKADWLKDGSGTAITDWLIQNSHTEWKKYTYAKLKDIYQRRNDELNYFGKSNNKMDVDALRKKEEGAPEQKPDGEEDPPMCGPCTGGDLDAFGKGKGKGKGQGCFKCGGSGHIERDCIADPTCSADCWRCNGKNICSRYCPTPAHNGKGKGDKGKGKC